MRSISEAAALGSPDTEGVGLELTQAEGQEGGPRWVEQHLPMSGDLKQPGEVGAPSGVGGER